MRTSAGLLSIAVMLVPLLAGCGSSGSAPSVSSGGGTGGVSNVQAISADAGPTGQFVNMVTTSVTICTPGTNTCQTIPNIQVDTGSTGLRLLASVVTLSLPAVTASGGATYGECADFADGFLWGSLASADVRMAGEVAAAMPVQIIQDTGGGPAVPSTCSSQGANESSAAALGANGLLGVGLFIQDCGGFCVTNTSPFYYTCTAGVCGEAAIPLAQQVTNPVAAFAQDNNGVVLQFPAIAATGATSASGNMIFGIGTQANNVLTASAIGVPDSGATAGSFTAVFGSTTLADSFIDSGSSLMYFPDASIPACPSSTPSGDLSGFDCPGVATALSSTAVNVTLQGSNAVSANVTINVANTQFLFGQPNASALNVFNDLGGPALAALPNSFDFGVPFFFGRSVFTAFEQRSTSAGTGPYFAFQ